MSTSRARLQQRDYVAAAFEIAGVDGLDALTLKALGARLGVDSTAVYRHFKSKDVLLAAMLDTLLEARLQPADAFATGRAELEHLAAVFHGVLVEYPPIAVAMITIADPPEVGTRMIERTVDALGRLGLEGEALVQHYQMLEHYVMGAAILDGDGSGDEWGVRRRIYEKVAAREFRSVAREPDSLQRVASQAFRSGIQALLDACEAAAR